MTTSRRAVQVTVTAATVAALALATGPAIAMTSTGPSSATSPYVLPVAEGVDITSLFTVGDSKAADNGYEMVGIPDGLGAFRQGANQVVYMNHELQAAAGVVRAHGEKGAFVSRLVIDPTTGRVKEGFDLIQDVLYYNYLTGADSEAAVGPAGAALGTHTNAFARFCSGALTELGQLYNTASKAGYKGRVYFANEESGDEGRVFGVTKDGTAYQLPRLGLFSWENTLAADNTSDTTLVMGNEDGRDGQLRAYIGTKQRSGSPVDKAGLTNGRLTVIDVPGIKNATSSMTYGKNVPRSFKLAPVEWNKSGLQQNLDAASVGSTFNRIEDGHFDPNSPNDYYFLTTEGGDKGPSAEGGQLRDGGGLWRLSFEDIERPEMGGTLTLLLDGTEVPYLNKPDNMTIDESGNLLIQEDPGGNDHLARIVAYRIGDGDMGVVAQFDRDRFAPGAAGFVTRDEESSGIIQLDDGSFLLDAQVHATSGNPETVELGQLLTMTVADWAAVYGDEG